MRVVPIVVLGVVVFAFGLVSVTLPEWCKIPGGFAIGCGWVLWCRHEHGRRQ